MFIIHRKFDRGAGWLYRVFELETMASLELIMCAEFAGTATFSYTGAKITFYLKDKSIYNINVLYNRIYHIHL